jgi:hypothetical protein
MPLPSIPPEHLRPTVTSPPQPPRISHAPVLNIGRLRLSSLLLLGCCLLLQVPVFDAVFLSTDLWFCHLNFRRVCQYSQRPIGVRFVRSLKTCYCELSCHVRPDDVLLSIQFDTNVSQLLGRVLP